MKKFFLILVAFLVAGVSFAASDIKDKVVGSWSCPLENNGQVMMQFFDDGYCVLMTISEEPFSGQGEWKLTQKGKNSTIEFVGDGFAELKTKKVGVEMKGDDLILKGEIFKGLPKSMTLKRD